MREAFHVGEENGGGNVETVGGIGVGWRGIFVHAKRFGFEMRAFLGVGEDENENVVDGAITCQLFAHRHNLRERRRIKIHHRSLRREAGH